VSDRPLSLQGRRVVVLGATGFIGRWVARALSGAGAQVWLGARHRETAERLAGEYGIAGTIAELDVTRAADLEALVRDARPEVTFNLAGYGVDRREVDAHLAAAINLELVTRLVELLSASPAPGWEGLSLLHAGSALEYGTVGGHLPEEGPTNPTTVYGQTKLAATSAIESAVSKGRLRALTARLFTVYGPGEHDGRLLPSILTARTAAEPVPMTDGYQRRDFTYVGDVAAGFLRCAAGGVPAWATVNLATGRLHTVREFVAQAESALGMAPGRFHFGALPTRSDDMAHEAVAVDRARQWLGWVPGTGIAEGVRATDAFLRTLPATPAPSPDWR
jgi:nucleoside-diphosphate-sugar epimerase